MAEYIDREAATAEILKGTITTSDLYGMGVMQGMDTALDRIQAVPAADVVEVPCRCKDCKNNPNFERHTKGMVWCRKFRCEVRETGFCSYGERRAE